MKQNLPTQAPALPNADTSRTNAKTALPNADTPNTTARNMGRHHHGRRTGGTSGLTPLREGHCVRSMRVLAARSRKPYGNERARRSFGSLTLAQDDKRAGTRAAWRNARANEPPLDRGGGATAPEGEAGMHDGKLQSHGGGGYPSVGSADSSPARGAWGMAALARVEFPVCCRHEQKPLG